jgi:REP element-mobilizing transposase RayT
VDRQDFLKTLAEACQKTDWQVHAYCLMSNHYHLVVETPNIRGQTIVWFDLVQLQGLFHPITHPGCEGGWVLARIY